MRKHRKDLTRILVDKKALRDLITSSKFDTAKEVSKQSGLYSNYINTLLNVETSRTIKVSYAESIAKVLGVTVNEFSIDDVEEEVKPIYSHVEIVKCRKKKEVDFKHWVSLPKREVDTGCVYELDRLGMRRLVARTNGKGVVIYLNEYVAHNALETLVQGLRNEH